jgi:tetratricopeptide (TPR) repeat protein
MDDDLKQLTEEMEELNHLNNQCVQLINDEKIDKALKHLKKAENKLEVIISNNKTFATERKINKKVLILILHNLACCYQKTQNYELCVDYLEAVIFNFDSIVEGRHKIKITLDYFKFVNNAELAHNKSLGDIILQVRFSAKFHLQMCSVLSQANNHDEAIQHAQIASYMCEDNIIKTYYLFYQIKDELTKSINDEPHSPENADLVKLDEKLNQVSKVVNNLYKQVTETQEYRNKLKKINFE